MDVFDFSESFEYENITLSSPQPVQGGSYYTKLRYNGSNLYVQLPKCGTKQGFVVTKKNKYSDLMYESINEETLIEWVEQIENTCQNLIDKNKALWFHTELTRDDITSMMTPICRVYRSGKNLLMRVSIEKDNYTGKDKCIAYDESETLVDLSDITNKQYIIPLICVEGIKFTSRSFDIHISLKQIMVLNKVEDISTSTKCMIKRDTRKLDNNGAEKVNNENVSSLTSLGKNVNTNELNKDLSEEEQIENIIVEKPQCIVKHNDDKEDDEEKEEKEDKDDDKEDDQHNDTHEEVEQKVVSGDNESKNNLGRDLDEGEKSTEKTNIEEVDLNIENIDDTIDLKDSHEVYNDIYKEAIRKAKKMRTSAVNAFMEAEKIKLKYNLQHIDEYSDSDSDISISQE